MLKQLVVAAAAVAAISTAASATDYTIADVTAAYSDPPADLNVAGYGNLWATPIIFTGTSTGAGGHKPVTLVVYCDDLTHVVYVEGGQDLRYHTEPVNSINGVGTISKQESDILGLIAGIGITAYDHGNEDGAIAAQGAIWESMTGAAVTSANPTIQADIYADLLTTVNGHPSFADGLVSQSDTQNMILPTIGGNVGAVPEPATWALMAIGFGSIMLVAARKRKVAYAAL